MNKIVQLIIVLATLASGACKADAGLCKPLCAEEKRTCRTAAVEMTRYETQPKYMGTEKNAMAREFGNGVVRTNQAMGPEALELQNRKATRNSVCEDKHAACAKACSASSVSSDVLVKPAPEKKGGAF